VETWFICKQESKLADIDLSSFKGYKEGDFLLVHIPYRKKLITKEEELLMSWLFLEDIVVGTNWLSCVFLRLNLKIIKLNIICCFTYVVYKVCRK
jgi:hypothetical protein